jgi:hypothetical protein
LGDNTSSDSSGFSTSSPTEGESTDTDKETEGVLGEFRVVMRNGIIEPLSKDVCRGATVFSSMSKREGV